MTITNFRKAKKLKVTEVPGQPTISRTACLKITSGDDTATGTGEIVLDWTNIGSKADIGIYDENDNLLDYYFESFDATAETAVIWVYRSWVRDGTVQLQVAYGDGPSDQSVGASTVFGKETDLAAGYLFNESSGDLIDVSGNGEDGTVYGATQGVEGIVGGAYDFDGSDDHVELTDIDITSEITIFIWAYRENLGGKSGPRLISKNVDVWRLRDKNDNGSLFFEIETSDGSASPALSYENETWFCAVARYDGSNVEIFKNGELSQSENLSGDIATSNDNIYIAFEASGVADPGDRWQGKADHTRLYDSTLTSDEIDALYDATKPSPSLFDQGAGSGFATISGQVTLSGSGVEGAKLFLVNETTGELEATTTSDANGDYGFGAARPGDTYHVAVQYDDGTDKYNAKSKPYLVP